MRTQSPEKEACGRSARAVEAAIWSLDLFDLRSALGCAKVRPCNPPPINLTTNVSIIHQKPRRNPSAASSTFRLSPTSRHLRHKPKIITWLSSLICIISTDMNMTIAHDRNEVVMFRLSSVEILRALRRLFVGIVHCLRSSSISAMSLSTANSRSLPPLLLVPV
jgi:hypothetical protein